MGSISPTSPVRILRRQKKAQAVELRLKGWTFAAIAEELGYRHPANTFRLVAEALDELAAKATENAAQLRTLELERLMGIVRDAEAILRDPKSRAADRLRALELKVRVSESIRKLWGLDAPVKVAPTSPDGEEQYTGLSDAELERELAAALATLGRPTE